MVYPYHPYRRRVYRRRRSPYYNHYYYRRRYGYTHRDMYHMMQKETRRNPGVSEAAKQHKWFLPGVGMLPHPRH